MILLNIFLNTKENFIYLKKNNRNLMGNYFDRISLLTKDGFNLPHFVPFCSSCDFLTFFKVIKILFYAMVLILRHLLHPRNRS